jgi:hypothetical protein
MLVPAIHSWTVFFVAVEYFQEESSCLCFLCSQIGEPARMDQFCLVGPDSKMLRRRHGVDSPACDDAGELRRIGTNASMVRIRLASRVGGSFWE